MSMLNFSQEITQPNFGSLHAGSNATTRTNALGIHEEYIYELLDASGDPLTVASMKAAVGLIEMEIAGTPFREIYAEDLLNLEKYFGRVNVAGQLVIPTYRMDLKTDAAKYAGMWGMGNQPSVSHKIKILDTATTQLDNIEHSVKAYPQQKNEQGKARVIGNHNKILTKEFSVPESGLLYLQDLMGMLQCEEIIRIHLVDSAGASAGDAVFKTAKLARSNGNLVREISASRANKIAYDAGRVPQDGYLHLELDNKSSALRVTDMRGQRDLDLHVEFSTVPTTGRVRVIFETLNGVYSANPEDVKTK